MPKKMTEKRVTQIAEFLENEYNPEDKTSRGHTKYASAVPQELGLELNFKPDKGVSVKIGGQRIPLGDLDKDQVQSVIDNFENLEAIGNELGTKSVSSSAKII